jgi:hypothetical protein
VGAGATSAPALQISQAASGSVGTGEGGGLSLNGSFAPVQLQELKQPAPGEPQPAACCRVSTTCTGPEAAAWLL